MAYRIKITKGVKETHHIGTFALPSEHAISVHAEVGLGKPRWIYSEDPEQLKDPRDVKEWKEVIFPALQGELKKKMGGNRRQSKILRLIKKQTFKKAAPHA